MVMGIIDFHSHFLPDMDDGSKNIEMTETMLRISASQGIDTMVATPHFYGDSMTINNFLANRANALHKTEGIAADLGIRIISGSETAFFPGISRAEKIEELCIGDTKLLLLEMPFRPWTEKDLQEIRHLIGRGIKPIIAHLERFYHYQTDKEIIPAVLDMPVYIQLNVACLLHWNSRRLPLKLFKSGQAHLLGSDSHNITSRPQNLADGRKVLEKKLGIDFLEEMDRFGISLLEV